MSYQIQLFISLLINIFLLFVILKDLRPKKITNLHMKPRFQRWWVVKQNGKYLIRNNKGEKVPHVVKGSFKPSKDRRHLNQATLKVYVNFADSEAEMLSLIEHNDELSKNDIYHGDPVIIVNGSVGPANGK